MSSNGAGHRRGGPCPARGGAEPLRQGDPPVPTFGESISLWESPEVAAERLAASASVTSECGSFEQEMFDGSTATVKLLPRDVPQPGDEAVGVVIEFDQDEGPTICGTSRSSASAMCWC